MIGEEDVSKVERTPNGFWRDDRKLFKRRSVNSDWQCGVVFYLNKHLLENTDCLSATKMW